MPLAILLNLGFAGSEFDSVTGMSTVEVTVDSPSGGSVVESAGVINEFTITGSNTDITLTGSV